MPFRARNPLTVIRLTPGTSTVNFVAYLMACLLTISLFVFFNAVQTFVLSIILKVPSAELASTGGLLVFADQLLSLMLLGTWGIVSDKVGRRFIFVMGFFFMGASMLGFSFSRNVFPELIICRLLFAVGAAACSGMITAVLADYINEKDKGKVSGLVGLCSGFGALIGVFGFSALPSYFREVGQVGSLEACLHYSYVIVGLISIVSSFILIFTLRAPDNGDPFSAAFWRRHWKARGKSDSSSPRPSPEITYRSLENNSEIGGGMTSDTDADTQASSSSRQPLDIPASSCPFSGAKRHPSQDSVTGEPQKLGCTMPGVLEQEEMGYRSFWALVVVGFKLGWKRPSLLLAYLGSFIARGDSIIITVFLPIWINRYFTSIGVCQDGGANLDDPIFVNPDKLKCAEAFRIAYIYSGIAQVFALIGAPIFGFLSDKMERPTIFFIAAFLSFAGYFPLSFLTNPVDQKIIYLFMILLGLGEIGMIVTSLSLATSGLPKDVRGSVAGCYSLFGGLGILIMTSLGGALADKWITAPFFVIGTLSGLIAIIALLFIIISKNKKLASAINTVEAPVIQ